MAKPDVLKILDGESLAKPPIWMMRQAGRYLAEYRAVREQAGSFLNLCFDPQRACEVTLQPINRFGFDAAILFSDILVVPHALGQTVRFETGEGPRFEPLAEFGGVGKLADDLDDKVVGKVYEAVRLIRATLPADKALLGFCGAPWTLATYMVAGRGGDEQYAARMMAFQQPEEFQALIDRLVAASIIYLVGQLGAGADAVQIFDTWAGVLDREGFQRWVLEPTRKIVAGVRQVIPGARIICFPKGCGRYAGEFAQATATNALGLDWSENVALVRRETKDSVAFQGNLDPLALIAGGDALDRAVDSVLEQFRGSRLIFNLGHGIRPETSISHVEQMIRRVRG